MTTVVAEAVVAQVPGMTLPAEVEVEEVLVQTAALEAVEVVLRPVWKLQELESPWSAVEVVLVLVLK